MPVFQRDGVALHYGTAGVGVPFVFQHGLGSDRNQPFALFHPPAGVRLIGFDARGHGGSALGSPEMIGFDTFADDLAGLLTQLGLERAVVGGISMGAGVALNFALRYPARTLGLVLSRPAWRETPNPFNTRVFPLIARLIREHGATEGRRRFEASTEFASIVAQYPDVAKSLANQFANPRATDLTEALVRIPPDAPNRDLREWTTIRVPTLVLANRLDPVHPFEYGELLASRIPGAVLRELVSKSIDVARHEREVQAFIGEFLDRHFLT